MIYLGGRRSDCFVEWLTERGAWVLIVGRLSFMSSLPSHATDHSSSSLANHGAFAILDVPRFWKSLWRDYKGALDALTVDPGYALFTDVCTWIFRDRVLFVCFLSYPPSTPLVTLVACMCNALQLSFGICPQADMIFTGDVGPSLNLAQERADFPPRELTRRASCAPLIFKMCDR